MNLCSFDESTPYSSLDVSQDINNQACVALDVLKHTIAMSLKNHLQMNLQDLFANIPSEIIIEILSKLPVRSIISCKCVCKSWLNLLESREFVKSHLLRSIPGLAVYRSWSMVYKLFDFDGGHDLEQHEHHYKPLTKFKIPGCPGWICGSVNGLLFLCNWDHVRDHDNLHICNPITRDYIQLDCSEFVQTFDDKVIYGFGSSKITGQYKVVRLFKDYVSVPEEPYRVPKSECLCHVYTIGTGLWRRIPVVVPLEYDCFWGGAFLNGNLHWLTLDFEGYVIGIFCFELETELFSTFSSPLLGITDSTGLTIFRDCLCICNDSYADGYAIWLMKEYGVEKSWTKQFFVSNNWRFEPYYAYDDDIVWPIKIFKDGDILLTWQRYLLHYSKKYDTVQKLEMFDHVNDIDAILLEMFDHVNDIDAILYTPSFLSLKSFGMEKVISF